MTCPCVRLGMVFSQKTGLSRKARASVADAYQFYRRSWWQSLLVAVVAISFGVPKAEAQSLSIGTTNTLTAFSLDRNPTLSQTLSVRTSWNTGFALSVQVCVYMGSPMAGTGGNAVTIPASTVRVNGTSIVTGSTNCGVPTATLLARQFFLFGSSSRTDALTIDMSSFSAALPPDTYTGTINLVAVMQ